MLFLFTVKSSAAGQIPLNHALTRARSVKTKKKERKEFSRFEINTRLSAPITALYCHLSGAAGCVHNGQKQARLSVGSSNKRTREDGANRLEAESIKFRHEKEGPRACKQDIARINTAAKATGSTKRNTGNGERRRAQVAGKDEEATVK